MTVARPELANVEVESGVNSEGRPFCRINAVVVDGPTRTTLLEASGQLDPDEVRRMALNWLEAAESAEHDALVFNLLTRDLEAPVELAAALLVRLRTWRADGGSF
jgi:hypothetical protein